MSRSFIWLAGVALLLASCGGKEQKVADAIPKDSIVAVDSLASKADSLPKMPFELVTVFFAGSNAEGEYQHIAGLPDSMVARKINAKVDSIANRIVGFNLAPYIANPGVKDSNQVRLYGEVTISFRPATYHEGLVSFAFIAKRYGQKLGDTFQTATFDIHTGRQVILEDLIDGGGQLMLVSIRRHLAKADEATRYDCAFSAAWDDVDQFMVSPEGLRWEIEETAFPDRQFCKEGVHLLMDWKTLESLLKRDSPLVENLLKRG